jgi:transglutaminase-like putative cysteine protease
VISYSLKVEPTHFINWQQDPFANYQARLVFPEKTLEFKVTVDLVVEMAVYNPFDFFLEPHAETFPFAYGVSSALELAPYLVTNRFTPKFKQYFKSIDFKALKRKPMRTIDFLVQINQQLHQDIAYTIRMEPGVQTPEETLTLGSGSCRDSAWLLVNLLRHCGLAARFGLFDSARPRCEVTRRPQRHRGGLHRPTRVVRGVPTRRRLDWA